MGEINEIAAEIEEKMSMRLRKQIEKHPGLAGGRRNGVWNKAYLSAAAMMLVRAFLDTDAGPDFMGHVFKCIVNDVKENKLSKAN